MAFALGSNKDFEAIEKIIMRVFLSHSLQSLWALPDTFRLIRPNHWRAENIYFWGGIAFYIQTPFLGRVEVRFTHSKEQYFLIQFWKTEYEQTQVKLRVSGLTLDSIDKDLIKVIEEVRGMRTWPSKCDQRISDLHPLTGFDRLPEPPPRTYKLDAKKR